MSLVLRICRREIKAITGVFIAFTFGITDGIAFGLHWCSIWLRNSGNASSIAQGRKRVPVSSYFAVGLEDARRNSLICRWRTSRHWKKPSGREVSLCSKPRESVPDRYLLPSCIDAEVLAIPSDPTFKVQTGIVTARVRKSSKMGTI